jgi:hypothetical protein
VREKDICNCEQALTYRQALEEIREECLYDMGDGIKLFNPNPSPHAIINIIKKVLDNQPSD